MNDLYRRVSKPDSTEGRIEEFLLWKDFLSKDIPTGEYNPKLWDLNYNIGNLKKDISSAEKLFSDYRELFSNQEVPELNEAYKNFLKNSEYSLKLSRMSGDMIGKMNYSEFMAGGLSEIPSNCNDLNGL